MARLKILHRDKDLVIIHKPSGMNTYNDEKGAAGLSAYDVLKKQFAEAKLHPVHRLDRGTDGLLIFALRPDVANLLTKMFREEKVKKTYWALVWGDPTARGEWKKPLSDKAGGATQRAQTKFRSRGRFETEADAEGKTHKFTWLECEPKTGRYHQIRRHAAEAGYPIIGDPDYSTEALTEASKIFGMKRIALSSIRLEFMHPTLRKPVLIETYPETTFGKILRQLENSV